jgi:hypothetical protein
MRTTRNVLIVFGIGLVLLATPELRAQHSGGCMNADCGCNQCAPACGDTCCPSLLPCLTEGVQNVLSGLFCCPALNARHSVYRAALKRNDFGKCSKLVPFYSCRQCPCGRVSPGCQSCGPTEASTDGQVIDVQDVPQGQMMEPTPALEPDTPAAPADVVPPASARARSPQTPGRSAVRSTGKPAVSRQTSRGSAMRDRVARAETRDATRPAIRQTGAEQTSQPSNMIEPALLLQSRDTLPTNTLRSK